MSIKNIAILYIVYRVPNKHTFQLNNVSVEELVLAEARVFNPVLILKFLLELCQRRVLKFSAVHFGNRMFLLSDGQVIICEFNRELLRDFIKMSV